jgi:hypothetical protein
VAAGANVAILDHARDKEFKMASEVMASITSTVKPQ